MIRLKTLLEQANTKTKENSIRTTIRGGIQKVLGFFKTSADTVVNDIDKYQQKYKYVQEKIQSLVTGVTYTNMVNSQLDNSNASTQESFLQIGVITSTQSDLPEFKEISYMVTLNHQQGQEVNTYTYFLCNYYLNNKLTDSLGQIQKGYDTLQSIDTLEGKSGTMQMPQEFAVLVKSGFPDTWYKIRDTLSKLTGLTINVVDTPSDNRTDYR